ncbi:glycosyltransferase family 4 protein [Cesiribacter sp. SM1]|uniref:glycosyltransferase family 4 protein n=1 Tax=Cesiribacter sp. SM1 TaxID=2861196 RepID=UPI001CD7F5EC|nr:glycosyltransferase family 4 protein [Cesiribacter sp. SM1]
MSTSVTQITIGRFHHFHLARQMEKHGLLDSIWTGYPRFKLRDEQGVPPEKIQTFPWLQTFYMSRWRLGLADWKWLGKECAWWGHETLDRHVAAKIKKPTTLIALSGSGLNAGKAVKRTGGYYICDRGSSHIRYQNQILNEEYKRWGLSFQGVDPRIMQKEEEEYALADRITIPSEYVRQSFIKLGVPPDKLVKIPYGTRLERFNKVTDPPADRFRVLWVGSVSIRKGFFDLLEAFQQLKHPKKELVVVGVVSAEVKSRLSSFSLQGVQFRGLVPNAELARIYSSAHVFVLSSIEEGLAMVQGEALACGCPVIATSHTGCEDLFTDGIEGFVVPIRTPKAICDRLQQIADDPALQARMSEAALERVKAMKGWDSYGNAFVNMMKTL